MSMPDDTRPDAIVPMKVNAFAHVQSANSQLATMFPYLHAGAIVLCTSQFETTPENPVGYFIHENSVDEVCLILGSNGRGRVGDVWRGPNQHGVGFSAPHPYVSAVVITQRQQESGEQKEAVEFQCEQCAEPLARYEFASDSAENADVPALPTIAGSHKAALLIETEEQRTCKACGHVNSAFPL